MYSEKRSGFYSVIVHDIYYIYFNENPIFLINFLTDLMKMFKHNMKEFARSYVSHESKNPMHFFYKL